MFQPNIITVILNTNRKEDTLECLDSLRQSSYEHHAAIVLDNASTDGSIEAILSEYPEVQVIELKENLGYAGNNNVGIETALQQGADWIFVLNEDTIVSPDCLSIMIEEVGKDDRIGIVGPMVYHFNEPNVIQSAGGRLDRHWYSFHIGQNEEDHDQYSNPREVDWISGCALLIKRQVVEQIGKLDVRFFYYWEETEWCLRAHHHGWRILHIPAAKIWHKGVQKDYHPSPNVTYYATRNRFLMMAKHSASFSVWIYAGLQTARTLVSWTIKPKWRAMREHRNAMWQGCVDFLRHQWGMRPIYK